MDWQYAEEIESALTHAESQRLAELAAGKVALEVGGWFGRSTVNLASTADVVHSIDWHRGLDATWKDVYDGNVSLATWRGNIARYGLLDKVVLHMGTTAQVCPLFRAVPFDLIFIDADHSQHAVGEDIRQTKRLLRFDGAYAFHDYAPRCPGVKAACREWFGREPDELIDSLAVYRP